jgi:hypothetical protein
MLKVNQCERGGYTKCHRKELAILNELKKGVPTGQVCLKAKNIFKTYNVNENILKLEQNMKMKLQAKAQ